MENPPVPSALDPARLPPGTKVGPWRVVSWSAQGTYGAVYRAVSWGQDEPVLVALKLALHPEDPRFRREATVLSRLDHPSVPLVLDHGRWRPPSGVVHPYLTLAWVEGTPLYEWAREHELTSLQALQLVAHLARALQAIHKAGAVHRDVKGENVLVRHADTRAVLTDFGSANYRGAERLTWKTQPPGTPGYRSPEAWQFLLRFGLASDAHYVATSADDVFALGVTAYRLVTGQYPPSTEPGLEEAGAWAPEGSGPRPPLELNPRVEPRLNALILRMLSVSPKARGTAKELAEAAELATEQAGPEARQPLFERRPPPPPAATQSEPPPAREVKPTGEKASTGHAGHRAKARSSVHWIVPATVGLLLGIWVRQALSTRVDTLTERAEGASKAREREADTIAVGDTPMAATSSSSEAPLDKAPVASDVPEKMFQGQAQPDARGRCPQPQHVVHKGRCWVKLGLNAEACDGSGYVYEQDTCFAPVFATRRKPTSSPAKSR